MSSPTGSVSRAYVRHVARELFQACGDAREHARVRYGILTMEVVLLGQKSLADALLETSALCCDAVFEARTPPDDRDRGRVAGARQDGLGRGLADALESGLRSMNAALARPPRTETRIGNELHNEPLSPPGTDAPCPTDGAPLEVAVARGA